MAKTNKKPAVSPQVRRISRKSAPVAKRRKLLRTLFRKRMPLRSLLIIYGILILTAGASAGVVAKAYNANKPLPDPFTSGQLSAVSFSLYYPASLPKDYYVDLASVDGVQTGVITLRVTNGRGDSNPEGRSVTISQQAVPANFQFETFYSSFADKTTIKTKYGIATTGTIDGGHTRLASLVTKDGTWILLNAQSKVSTDDYRYILTHLTSE